MLFLHTKSNEININYKLSIYKFLLFILIDITWILQFIYLINILKMLTINKKINK